MKIYDMHTHAWGKEARPSALLGKMGEAGIFGGCVFSAPPKEQKMEIGLSFEERLRELDGWCKGYEDRIFPILWIHPDEENITNKVSLARERGVAGFKMICTDYYVYEEKCLQLLREIAKLGAPVFFHTGILWDGRVSSAYNRPVNWEALLSVKGLRFSLGHCSWPWIDECVALYGKFQNSLTYSSESAEMFFDITPGTPDIYREELLTKLYKVGYNVGDNIMFGTDCSAGDYSTDWAREWLGRDGEILEELGVSLENLEKLYEKNLMRFLGKSKVGVEKSAPAPDNANRWSPENPGVKEIIKKWYSRLGLPKCFSKEFGSALATLSVSDAITAKDYDYTRAPSKRNLLSLLYMCDEVEKKYAELKIPENILLDTLDDLRIYTEEWSTVKGELCLGETEWLKRHMNLGIFRLGRLQFAFGNCAADFPTLGVKRGEPILEIHIPALGKLTPEDCNKSIAAAKEFFKKYFPSYDYKAFTCHSWLLDETLRKYLPDESNIIKFADMFTRTDSEESSELLRYVFRWDTNAVNVRHAVANSSFAEKIKRAFLSGEVFHETHGAIAKD